MWLLLMLVLPASMVHGLTCCKEGFQMIQVEHSIYCTDFTLISIYKWCSSLGMLETSKPSEGEIFVENADRTQFTLNNETWDERYCTGSFSKNFTSDKSMENITEKMVAMICLEEEDGQRYILYATCLIISCVFLLATLIIYIWLPELRDLQGKCVLCFILSLMIGYLCLIYIQLPISTPDYDSDLECVTMGFLTYFWMMSAFFWLNINSFNMWRSAVLAHIHMSERRLMFAYYLAGWGLPLCFLIIALITHHLPGDNILRPNIGLHSCWFAGKLEVWSYFYGPVLVLLICNIVYFISTALYLWADYRSPNPMPRIKSLRIKFCLYFKLFLVMGITWIFEILSSIDNEPWYITDILNCFQGVIIFVVMILLRKRVWRIMASKKICGYQLGRCWEKMEDEETVNEIVDEQQLSSNNTVKP